VKKVRGRKGDIQRTVDGHTQNDFIPDIFANKYEDQYTSVRYDQTEMVRGRILKIKLLRLGMT